MKTASPVKTSGTFDLALGLKAAVGGIGAAMGGL